MSQPASVKWILPFREILARGFQTLPLTLAGTSAFFAATTTAPFFVVLTFVLSIILPALVFLWQLIGGFVHSKALSNTGSTGFAAVAGVVGLIAGGSALSGSTWGGSNYGFFTLTRLLEIVSLLSFFAANALLGPEASKLSAPPNLPCQLIGIEPDARGGAEIPIAPSFWLTPITFLSVYLFHNAYDNYTKPAAESAGADKVAKRKIQSVFSLISVPVLAIILITLRMYTGCETAISLVTSLFLGGFIAEFFYDTAKESGVDAYQMFQNLTMGIRKKDYRCFAEI